VEWQHIHIPKEEEVISMEFVTNIMADVFCDEKDVIL
jgi:hypothetical protein